MHVAMVATNIYYLHLWLLVVIWSGRLWWLTLRYLQMTPHSYIDSGSYAICIYNLKM